MKKLFGFKIGGLRQKIFSLVMIMFIIMTVLLVCMTLYEDHFLKKVVYEAGQEQENAIRDVSTSTMHQVLENSMINSNSMQASIADDMFNDVRCDVLTLQSVAQGLFSNKSIVVPYSVNPPDPSDDGTVTAQILWDEGVDYQESALLPVVACMSDTMVAMCESSDYMNNCYISLTDGVTICVDPYSANKLDEHGEVVPFPASTRSWYQDAIAEGGISYTGVIYDTFSGRSCVTCSAPVIVDGTVYGVVGIDLFLDNLESFVDESVDLGGLVCIVNEEGQVIFAPEDNALFSIVGEDEAEDLRQSSNTELADFVSMALSESTGLQSVTVDDKEYYMAGCPIPSMGWTVISVVEKDLTEVPANLMLEQYSSISESAKSDYSESMKTIQIMTIILMGAALLAGIATALYRSEKIVKPIESMTADIIEGGNTGKLFEMKPVYNTGDEIEVLAQSFDELSRKTKQYIEDITQITKDKERIGTELALATKIQASMLPHIFPPFPERKEFDIYAMMDPAREVGGDFYDYYLIDEDHLCLVVADVSGKGIPAALFMMISKTILQSCAMLGKSPAEVLDKTNVALCSNNQVEMFVTVWIGIIKISTGVLTAASAGHEYPVIKRVDGSFELYKDKHSLAVGAMEDTVYHEYEIKLNKGDKLFLYTDGVPEATDAEDRMFGTQRMLDALNKEPDADPKHLLNNVKNAVGEFVNKAEQFDDLTMLGFEYRGSDDDNESKSSRED